MYCHTAASPAVVISLWRRGGARAINTAVPLSGRSLSPLLTLRQTRRTRQEVAKHAELIHRNTSRPRNETKGYLEPELVEGILVDHHISPPFLSSKPLEFFFDIMRIFSVVLLLVHALGEFHVFNITSVRFCLCCVCLLFIVFDISVPSLRSV